ncbi:Rho GTPase activating protein [Knufia peltigerae]|uniref:Rho GTPase activating protein n=1 Tax=Knufia peltigerae TaxID=1002370 RepID=A0AA39CXG7_9EURO|nr:Rho GTPase activating protein [Knufia peltigerae]
MSTLSEATSRSPQIRLSPSAATVSSPSPTDPQTYVSNSRRPAQNVLGNNLIPRDYLSSRPGPGPGQSRYSEDTPTPTPQQMSTGSDAAIKSAPINIPQGKPALARGEAGSIGTSKSGLGASPSSSLTESRDNEPPPLSESPKSYGSLQTSAPPVTNMPRTSSIDSAISNISTQSHVQKQPTDTKEPSREEVLNLIATAGSAETLVLHLLRDKNHAAAQNAQLWKLVDKQRTLLLGLNKDLERVTKERDRYRKKVKELQSQTPAVPAVSVRPDDGESPRSDGDVSSTSRDMSTISASESKLRAEHQTPSKHGTVQTQSSPIDPAMMPPPLHLQQAPKIQSLVTDIVQPVFAVTEATPLSDKAPKSFQASRKAPPRPLDLRPTKEELASTEVVVSDGDDDEVRLPMERGRRKTREEDDRERELLVIKEQEARSRSKKDKEKKGKDETTEVVLDDMPLPPPAHSPPAVPRQAQPSETKMQDHLSPSSTLSAVSSTQLSVPLRSPGLPTSPRPFPSMGATLPMSPRAPKNNFPLSPRAPKQALPNPTTPGQETPAPGSHKKVAPSQLSKMDTNSAKDDVGRLQVHESPLSPDEAPPVSRSLVSPTWPDFLLPPNALPSIQIKVASSRLRPSRNSILGVKGTEEASVFSLSIFERATTAELWRVEKVPTSLPSLDQQLRPRCADLPKIPERKLFSGHSPVIIDSRRAAIESYFEELLDTPMDEQAAAVICKYLSTDVMDSHLNLPIQKSEESQNKTKPPPSAGIPTKSGYLTKKGKNFGGWKSRYFVLDSPELRYFEAPGGAHLGTIKLLNARIGRQTQTDPAANAEVDTENQYRHAFLILEPKRKDNSSYVRHVLCAENDFERDEWVETLLHYIDERPAEPKSQYGAGIPSTQAKDAKASYKNAVEEGGPKAAASPKLIQSQSDTPSPSNASSHTSEYTQEAASKSVNISGPMNGGVISDAGLWGNKSVGHGSSKEREQKKRTLFDHFRKSSYEQLAAAPQSAQPKRIDHNAHRGGHVRPVFGMQLQEAVEYYSPTDVDVYLPAVVYRCIEYLRAKNAASEEGLFRLSGSNIVIRALKDRFNTEGDVDLLTDEEDYDVHAVASLFKTYLRELPSTILTRELHLEFIKVLDLHDKAEKITAFNGLVHQLPSANFSLLRTLSAYLLEVVQNSDRNKMSVKNVGIVFSPTLNIPAPVFAMFLTEFEAIFEKTNDQGSIRSTEIDRAGALTPEDIRSPRRMMFTDLPTPAYNQSSFSHNASAMAASPGQGSSDHHMDTASDVGFSPIHPSYETRSYVSIPHDMPMQPRYPPPQPPSGSQRYGGSNNMLVPENAASAKAKRRESAMLFM